MAGVHQKQPAESFNDIFLLSKRLLRPGISVEESQALYNKWASVGTYDKVWSPLSEICVHSRLTLGMANKL